MKELIYQGAEARLYHVDDKVIKERVRKDYRIPEIDVLLRASRTKREEKVYRILESIKFPAPRAIECDGKQHLVMEYIKGKLIRDVLAKGNYEELASEVGKKIAILHNNGIIHGDLTTSNMILSDEIYFIDFGLSFFSQKIEDKATDLHLLKEAFESTHPAIWEESFECALKAYEKQAEHGKEILERLKNVEKRGRNKGKF